MYTDCSAIERGALGLQVSITQSSDPAVPPPRDTVPSRVIVGQNKIYNKDILEKGSECIGYPPVITGWYVLLHHQESIPNNQENSWAMSCVLINCSLDFLVFCWVLYYK